MAERRPLVIGPAGIQELPVGDTLPVTSTAIPSAIDQWLTVTQSGNFVCAYDGILDIMGLGAGASGAVAHTTGYATGPSAPGVVVARVQVMAGDAFSVSIGAKGLAVTRSASGQTAGNNGGNTTVTGPGGFSMTAEGGKGGKVGTALPLTGPEGGQGSGGAVRKGGNGGDILAGGNLSCTGTGAVNINNQPAARVKGGSINTTYTTNGTATGGAGVGGNGANWTGANGAAGSSSGGGSGGPAADNQSAVPGVNAAGVAIEAEPTELVPMLSATWGLRYFGGGSKSTGTTPPGPGGGGCGFSGLSSTTPQSAGGHLAGAGALARTTGTMSAPNGNRNSGGSITAVSGTATSGEGDNGLVVFALRRTA